MTPEQEKFLNEMIASAKTVETNGHFVKPTVELVRIHAATVRRLEDRIKKLEASDGTSESVPQHEHTAEVRLR